MVGIIKQTHPRLLSNATRNVAEMINENDMRKRCDIGRRPMVGGVIF